MDVIFFNTLPFLVSISTAMKFITVYNISNRSKISLVNPIYIIVRHYKSHSLLVSNMFLDLEFQFLEKKEVSTIPNTKGACDPVPEVEWQIKVIKEHIRAHHANLPFPSFTWWMTIELANHAVMFLNALPPKSGLLTTYIPKNIMMSK